MDTPTISPGTLPVAKSSSWKWTVLTIVVLAAIAVAALFAIRIGLPIPGFVSNATSTPPAIVAHGVPFIVATSTPPARDTSYENLYIPWQVSVHPSQLPQIKKLIGTSTPRVSQDAYGLFVTANTGDGYSDSSSWSAADHIAYYNDGDVTSGKYLGYHLIIAEYPSDGPGPATYYTFATKDYSSFIADGSPNDVPNPGIVNTQKVIGVDAIPVHFPATIPLTSAFVLAFGADEYSSGFATTGPSTDATLLSSLPDGTKLYATPQELTKRMTMYSSNTALAAKLSDYIDSTTKLTICSQHNNCFGYDLSFPDFSTYETSPYIAPVSGDSGTRPYQKLEIRPGTQDAHFYSNYSNLLPYGCGTDSASWSYTLKNIKDTDVFDTGRSWQGVELYAFTNPENSPVVNAEYTLKKADPLYRQTADSYTEVSMPPVSEYTSKYPVLLFKDPWGRWVGMTENEYEVSFGCGKPVIYLYPPKPTAVSLSFKNLPNFAINIPTYHDGWDVFAQPNGSLTDLQPEYTNCTAIDSKHAGSEYAADACAKHTYPYLYWSGRANGEYPSPTGGWVVSRNELNNKLKTELTRIGLTERESEDMRSYWVPRMLENTAPYYRISFLTTAQMNAFVPMNVHPAPQSVLRTFLDWSPLPQKPQVMPRPQEFPAFSRAGFTMVEWGGLER